MLGIRADGGELLAIGREGQLAHTRTMQRREQCHCLQAIGLPHANVRRTRAARVLYGGARGISGLAARDEHTARVQRHALDRRVVRRIEALPLRPRLEDDDQVGCREGHLARGQEAEVAPAVDAAVAVHELQLEPAAARLAAREPLGPRRRAALDERLQQLLGHGLKGSRRLQRLAGSRDQPLRFRCCGAALLVVLHLRI